VCEVGWFQEINTMAQRNNNQTKVRPESANPVSVVASGETEGDDEEEGETLEGEVLEGEDFQQYSTQVTDDVAEVRGLIIQVKAHSKEGRRLMFITASSICVCALTRGQEAMPLLDEFIAALGEEGKNQYRTNSFRKFFETAGPFVWDTNRMVKKGDKEVKKAGLVLHETKRSDLLKARNKDKVAFDSGLMKVSPWKMAGREAGYVPVDVPATLRALAKRARKNLTPEHIAKTKATGEDVAENNLALLDQIEEMLLRYDQARNRAPAQTHVEHATQQ
jgi:hypothetical protein